MQQTGFCDHIIGFWLLPSSLIISSRHRVAAAAAAAAVFDLALALALALACALGFAFAIAFAFAFAFAFLISDGEVFFFAKIHGLCFLASV